MGTQSLSPLGPLAIPLPSSSPWPPWGPQGLPVVYGQGPVWDPGAPFRRMANANLSPGPSTPFRALDYVLQCLRFFFLASLTVTRIGERSLASEIWGNLFVHDEGEVHVEWVGGYGACGRCRVRRCVADELRV